MKRTSLLALLAALMLLPAVALARRGDDHGLRHRHGKVGRVASFDARTGELALMTRGGRERSALVTDDTRIRCTGHGVASAARHGDGDDDPATHDVGDDHGDDDPATHDVGDDHGDDDPATHDVGDDHGDDDPATHDVGDDHGDDRRCDEDDLAEGRLVRRARIDTSGDDAVWTRVKLAHR